MRSTNPQQTFVPRIVSKSRGRISAANEAEGLPVKFESIILFT